MPVDMEISCVFERGKDFNFHSLDQKGNKLVLVDGLASSKPFVVWQCDKEDCHCEGTWRTDY
jgi:hypothetical protein